MQVKRKPACKGQKLKFELLPIVFCATIILDAGVKLVLDAIFTVSVIPCCCMSEMRRGSS